MCLSVCLSACLPLPPCACTPYFQQFTAVQANTKLQLHPGPVSDFEVRHEADDIKRHVGDLPCMAVAIGNGQPRDYQQRVTYCLHLEKRISYTW